MAETYQATEARPNEENGRGGIEREVYQNPAITREEAVAKTLEYFGGDKLAAPVWVDKYALKDSKGNVYESTPDDMHHRIAREIARVEQKYPNPMSEEQVYSLMKDFKYVIPQGSPMAGIGNDGQVVSLANCFVIGNDSDSYGGIMQTDQEQVQLMKRRGGVGHDLSHLRPHGSTVLNSALTSTGVSSFMERYSNSTREVAQEGRRGALMLSISIKHPDAENFIDAKLTAGKVTAANISVRVDDEFMQAVQNGETYTQQYPVDSDSPQITKEIDARGLWSKIIHNAWQSAEPGVLFWDTIVRESVADSYADEGFKTVSTNPCGEIPLPAYDSCRLQAINLFSYVNDPFTERAKFDFGLFKEHVGYAQRMMDDILDLELEKIDGISAKIEKDPEEGHIKEVERSLWGKIKQKAEEGRRTGLGITAEGDMLAALNLRYGSDEATEFSTQVHKTLALEAYRSSVEMAKERGSFPIYDSSKEESNPFVQRIKEADEKLYQKMVEDGRRNIALLTIAPTGTTSLMSQTTSGIEPIFLPVYERRRKVNPNDEGVNVDYVDEVGDSWERFKVVHPKFLDWLGVKGYDVKRIRDLADESERDKTKDKELREIMDETVVKSPYHQATANDIDWVAKVRMQGAIQKWVDHSISVTVNVPSDTLEGLVDKLYQTAWEEGCKGVTVYRDGSREGVLLTGKEKDGEEVSFKELEKIVAKRLSMPRPENIEGRTERVATNYSQHAFVTFNFAEDTDGELVPYETFINVGKAGGDLPAIVEGYGRLMSVGLKAGISPDYIAEQLGGIGGETQQGIGDNRIRSIPDAIARGISTILQKSKKMGSKSENGNNNGFKGNLCPDCASPLIMEEGCEKCTCGFSKC